MLSKEEVAPARSLWHAPPRQVGLSSSFQHLDFNHVGVVVSVDVEIEAAWLVMHVVGFLVAIICQERHTINELACAGIPTRCATRLQKSYAMIWEAKGAQSRMVHS